MFPIDLPAVGVAISLRSTTAESLSEISGGCCLHSSSMRTAGRNGLLTQVCCDSITVRQYLFLEGSSKAPLGKNVRKKNKNCVNVILCVYVFQVQALPSTASVCAHHSVAQALKMASCGFGP